MYCCLFKCDYVFLMAGDRTVIICLVLAAGSGTSVSLISLDIICLSVSDYWSSSHLPPPKIQFMFTALTGLLRWLNCP